MNLLECLPQACWRIHYTEKKVLQIQVVAGKYLISCFSYLNTVVLTSPSCAGVNYVHQFCVGAAKGVLSPFVLQEIIMEALQRLNPAHVHNHLRTPAFHQLVQRCQQAYMQVTCGLSSCLSKLPGFAGTACVCAEGKGPCVLVAELVHCLMHRSPSAGTRIGIACLCGGCIIVLLLPRPLTSCAHHEGWSGSVFPVHFLSPNATCAF